jgi:hypothetical protein
MVCPLERKYSRKLERISFDFTRRFYCSTAKNRGAADTPEPLSLGKPKRSIRPYKN